MRRFQDTHPWITFQVDLRRVPLLLWMRLGEAQSKCQHLREAPLLPEVSRSMHEVSLIRGVMATTAIEGNTLTEDQIRQRREGKLELPASKEYLGQEVDNILEACAGIANQLLNHEAEVQLCVDDIKRFNALVLRDLPTEEHVRPGRVSDAELGVGRYRGAPPEDREFLLERLCDWLKNDFDTPGDELQRIFPISFGVLKAVIAHLYLAWIHPFGDGNGRTARLVEFHILVGVGVPTVAAHLLSNHYNETRAEYYRQLDYASRSGGDVTKFIAYAIDGFIDGLRGQIKQVQNQQLRVLWERYVYNQFRHRKGVYDQRRQTLIFGITGRYFQRWSPIGVHQVRTLNTKVAVDYANVGDRSIKRDLELLTEMGLLKRVGEMYKPALRTMRAFTPAAMKTHDAALKIDPLPV